jgi:HEPN domain-containing protein
VFRIFTNEVAGTKLFAMDKGAAAYYGRAAEVFGMEPVVAFPGAEFDLEEAGKCLALARNTACIFHLMRAMELALQALCARLGVTDVQKRWGFLLQDIDNALEAMPKDARQQWSTVRSGLWHVKEAWRNDTMHPNEKYTDEEAREVLYAVKVFLRSLAPMAAIAA